LLLALASSASVFILIVHSPFVVFDLFILKAIGSR
jgi:hypothetical protein